MIIKKLKIKNIRSYEEFEISFPIGSTLLAGDIGAGKTSILLALQFSLFGLQPGQKGASLLRNGEDEAYSCLEMEVDGKQIILERTLKRTKQGISQDSNSITFDGAKQDLSASEMKNKVIEILDYPKEFVKKSNLLYKFTVYTPQEEMKEIIQESPEIRLDTLRHVFGIDRYKRIKENVEILLQRIKESIKLKEVEIKDTGILKEKLALDTEKKVLLAREVNNLKLQLDTANVKKYDEEKNLKDFEKLIDERRKVDSEILRKDTELKGKKEFRLRIEREIALMQKNQERIDFTPERLEEVSNLLEKHKLLLEEKNEKLGEINSKISVLNSRKDQAFQLRDKVAHLDQCPTCMQAVGNDYKDLIAKRTQYDIEEINREINPRVYEKSQMMNEIDREKELIKGYEHDKRELEKAKIKFQHQKEIDIKIKSDFMTLERSKLEISDIELAIKDLKVKLAGYSEVESKYQDFKRRYEDLLRQIRLLDINLAQKSKESELLIEYIEKLNEEIAKKEKIKLQVNYLRELQDWLQEKFLEIINGIESNVLAKLRADFSKLFNEWFSALVSDSLSVRLDETFSPVISNQDYEIDYEFLSGGERTAVALAYRLALNQILNSMLSRIKTKGLIILDEPTDGFSEQQLDKMRDILEELNSTQTIIVSHEQKIEGFVDNVIRVRKEGSSRIGN